MHLRTGAVIPCQPWMDGKDFAFIPSLCLLYPQPLYSWVGAEGDLFTAWNETLLMIKSMAKACGHQGILNEISVPETH